MPEQLEMIQAINARAVRLIIQTQYTMHAWQQQVAELVITDIQTNNARSVIQAEQI